MARGICRGYKVTDYLGRACERTSQWIALSYGYDILALSRAPLAQRSVIHHSLQSSFRGPLTYDYIRPVSLYMCVRTLLTFTRTLTHMHIYIHTMRPYNYTLSPRDLSLVHASTTAGQFFPYMRLHRNLCTRGSSSGTNSAESHLASQQFYPYACERCTAKALL